MYLYPLIGPFFRFQGRNSTNFCVQKFILRLNDLHNQAWFQKKNPQSRRSQSHSSFLRKQIAKKQPKMWIIDQQYIKLGKPGRTPGRNQEVELTYKFPEFKEIVILWTIIHLNCTLTSVLLLLYTTIAEISKFCPNIMKTFVIH